MALFLFALPLSESVAKDATLSAKNRPPPLTFRICLIFL